MKNLNQILLNRKKLRDTSPLIHAITNPIAITMVANGILATGAKAICAAHPDEVSEIVNMSKALSLNLGNITSERMIAMRKASQCASKKNIPLALDAVGVGASTLRLTYAKDLLEKYHFDLIKGNSSEIKALAGEKSEALGIDVGKKDEIREGNIESLAQIGRRLYRKYNSTILITGKSDLLVTEDRYFVVNNGVENLSKITATGCMLTGIISSFMAVTDPLEASLMGLILLEISAEMANTDRLGTFLVNLMDEISTIDDEVISQRADIREVEF